MLEEVFRVAHTLKGNASFMDLNNLVHLTHVMEDVFQQLKKNNSSANVEIIDTLFSCKDVISQIGNALKKGQDASLIATEHLVDKINNFSIKKNDTTQQIVSKTEKNIVSQTNTNFTSNNIENEIKNWPDEVLFIKAVISLDEHVPTLRSFLLETRISAVGKILKKDPVEDTKIDETRQVLFWVESTLVAEEFHTKILVDLLDTLTVESIKKTSLIPKNNSSDDPDHIDALSIQSVRIALEDLDSLLNSVGELVILNSSFYKIQEMIVNNDNKEQIVRKFRDTLKHMLKVSIEIQTMVMNSRLVPIDQVFNRFKRFVRDYSSKHNKQVDFTITGGSIELDKKLIEEIVKPLTHVVRNALDHGLETVEERLLQNKNPTGILKLSAIQTGNYVYIQVKEDGRGLNYKKIVEKAIERGLVAPENAKNLTEADIQSLIFQPGFSSKDTVDEMSGRGVGLDVVKTVVESLNGKLEFISQPGRGSEITLILPLTVAIIEAFLVKISGDLFFIPIKSVIEASINKYTDIFSVDNIEAIEKSNTLIPLIRPNYLINGKSFDEISNETNEADYFYSVLVQEGKEYYILKVDEFIQKQEIVIKSLAENYQNIKAISGASLLGDGSIALIIDVSGLIKLYFDVLNGNQEENEKSILVSTSPKNNNTIDINHHAIEQNTSNLNLEKIDIIEPTKIIDEPNLNNNIPIIQENEQSNMNMKNQQEILKKVNLFLAQEDKTLIKEWFKEANNVAIQGLALMTGMEIKIKKSVAKNLPFQKITELLERYQIENKGLVNFILPILPINGGIHLIMTEKNCAKVMSFLLQQVNISPSESGMYDTYEPILELLNIIGSAYTNSLANLTNLLIEPGVPEVCSDINLIKNMISADNKNSDNLLYVQNQFTGSDNQILAEILISIPQYE